MNQKIQTTAHDRFRAVIKSYANVPEEDIDIFFEQFEPVEFKKGEVVLNQGEICRHLYFILSGGFRCFRLDEKGREINLHFYFENDIASEFRSLRYQDPSDKYIVAIAPTRALKAARPDYLRLFDERIELMEAAMRFFQETLFEEEALTETLRNLSAEERYQYVLENQPHMLQKVPLTQLASWLGVSRESLSRIRNKLATSG